jgi:hypothetical protein
MPAGGIPVLSSCLFLLLSFATTSNIYIQGIDDLRILYSLDVINYNSKVSQVMFVASALLITGSKKVIAIVQPW